MLLYDLTSTYFEGEAKEVEKAQRGYSRDHRPDCKQVVIALVVTPEGFPLSYEVFDGKHVVAGGGKERLVSDEIEALAVHGASASFLRRFLAVARHFRHDIAPCARGHFWVVRGRVGAGEREVEDRLFVGLVLRVEQF